MPAIPSQLNSNASRYKVSSVNRSVRADDVLQIVAEMEDSGVVNIAYHANDPNAGLSSHEDIRAFKLYAADTGLFVTLAFNDKKFTENDIYRKLLSDKLQADLGYVYENMVAQMLVAAGHRLFYHTFRKETSNHNYEVDFLLSRKHKICPVEVKSSGYLTHASLDEFCRKFSSRILEKYIIYTKDMRMDHDISCIPIYLTMFL